MQAESTQKSRLSVRIWLAIFSTIAAGIAIVPPAITAFRASPTAAQTGTGNVAVIGSTVGSNNVTTNTYLSMWVEGARTIVGSNPRPVVIQSGPSPTQTATAPALATAPGANLESKEPERGAIGRLVINASLMNDASWSPEPSRVPRLLTFILRAEATSSDEKQGTMDATLFRDGRDVCTVSLNTKTSPLGSGVRWSDATCTDSLPPNGVVTYKAKVKAVEMTPVTVRLTYVDSIVK